MLSFENTQMTPRRMYCDGQLPVVWMTLFLVSCYAHISLRKKCLRLKNLKENEDIHFPRPNCYLSSFHPLKLYSSFTVWYHSWTVSSDSRHWDKFGGQSLRCSVRVRKKGSCFLCGNPLAVDPELSWCLPAPTPVIWNTHLTFPVRCVSAASTHTFTVNVA